MCVFLICVLKLHGECTSLSLDLAALSRKRLRVCGQSGSTSQTGSCGSAGGKAAAMLLELLHAINAS